MSGIIVNGNRTDFKPKQYKGFEGGKAVMIIYVLFLNRKIINLSLKSITNTTQIIQILL